MLLVVRLRFFPEQDFRYSCLHGIPAWDDETRYPGMKERTQPLPWRGYFLLHICWRTGYGSGKKEENGGCGYIPVPIEYYTFGRLEMDFLIYSSGYS